jgi:hypothetical protein
MHKTIVHANKPGLRLVANNAASIASVPEPHIGLIKGDFWSHWVAKITLAAKASNMGALPGIFR